MWEIAREMDLTPPTIETHIVKLYEQDRIRLPELLYILNFSHLQQIKTVIQQHFWENTDMLKPMKEKASEMGYFDITYFEIKAAIAMLGKKDL